MWGHVSNVPAKTGTLETCPTFLSDAVNEVSQTASARQMSTGRFLMTEETATAETEVPQPQPLRSKHTASFPALLQQLGISLVVTTYQAGKVVLLRADGDKVNTHFRDFPRPKGLAADRTRLAVGTAQEIRQFRNMPAVCRRLEPPGRHDACYLPRAVH